MPAELEEIKSTRKILTRTAQIAALLFVCVIAASVIVRVKADRAQDAIERRKQGTPDTAGIEKLLAEMSSLNAQYDRLKERYSQIQQFCSRDKSVDWAVIMDEIRKKTPAAVCVTNLKCNDNSNLVIEGQSLSFNSVNVFAKLLGESDLLSSAVVLERSRETTDRGMVSYIIKCVMKSRKEEATVNAG